MEIKLRNPINLTLKLLDTENRLPSMMMSADLQIAHPTGTASYKASDIWFDCTQWDGFTDQLSNLGNEIEGIALLASLSGYFLIKIEITKGIISATVTCKEPDTGNGSFEFSFFKNIDFADLANIKRGFLETERWW
jgi:hypothetical protein